MSGGVDSSTAAALLKEQGYQVSGVTMKIWDGEISLEEGTRHGCYGPGEEGDIEDAQRVAQILGIPLHILDLTHEYKTEVLNYFCQEFLAGSTPNPCLVCNRNVKFDALIRKAQDSGVEFDNFATGHYARVEYNEDKQRYILKKARDLAKDQSYFISLLSQDQLACSLFPLGDYTKEEVRKIASDFGLGVNNKPESQDFVAGGYSSLIATTEPGLILDKNGNILGEHRGIPFYTIGQRKGLGISAKEPLYVIDIDPEKNAIIVSKKEDLFKDELLASRLNWIAIEALKQPTKVKAKIRNLHPGAEATITPLGEDTVHLKFKEPQMAITPGQAVVFYQGDMVLGAGTIEKMRE